MAVGKRLRRRDRWGLQQLSWSLRLVVTHCAAVLLLAGNAICAEPVCASCHPAETAHWQASGMGQSLVRPAALPSAKVDHAPSGSVLKSEQRDGSMQHSLSEQGLEAFYPVRYQVGGDLMGRTYMVQVGNYLFESPLSYFKRYGWDLSPGYAGQQLIDFDRPVDNKCLFCHAGSAKFANSDGRRLANTNLESITCERCHGPSEAHVRHPSRANIVNPSHLDRVQRDSVCEQCHLEGATRLLNPGKDWPDFRPGEAAELTFATYVVAGSANKAVNAVDHVEQLAQSKCARATQGKLWCGSCHDPHGGPVVDRAQQIRVVCTGCHVTLSQSAHPTTPSECTNCHMPSSSTTDIPHAARTDHRILRRASEGAAAGPEKVVAWRQPPAGLQQRDLGLAEVLVGHSKQLPGIEEDGWKLLHSLPDEKRDAAVLSDLQGEAMQRGDLETAAKLGGKLQQLRPDSALAALNLGIVLRRAGKRDEAERALKAAITLDASFKSAYIELAGLYANEGRMDALGAVIDNYLKFNPQDIMFRLQKQRLEGR